VLDLRGYGKSGKPQDGKRHENYSFRAMAQDQVDVMRHYGHERFLGGTNQEFATKYMR
jgi:haloacetate dehalogenase